MRHPSIAVLVFALVLPSLARASEDYPDEIEGYVPTPSRPACTLCHIGHVENYDSVRTPFGVSMRSRGLVADDAGSLFRAIDLLRAQNVDSDADGVPDIDELTIGTDPNGPDSTYKPVRYGCTVTTRAGAASPTSDSSSALVLVLVALVVYRTRASRHGLRRPR